VALSDRLTNYYREARRRAQRRKSAWNILLSLFCIGSGLALWCASFRTYFAFIAIVENCRTWLLATMSLVVA
jgi:hypothetical protein